MGCVPGADVPGVKDYDPYIVQNYTAITIPPNIPLWVITIKIVFYAIAFLLALVGNIIVILIITLNKRMKNTTNVFLLNLAISDLMVGCFCMWIHLGNSITKEWPFGEYVCKVNTFMQVLAVTSSVLSLTAISVERFFAILFPLKRPKTTVITTVVVVSNWLLSFGMALPHLIVRRTFEYYWKDRHEVWCDEVWPEIYIDTDCHTKAPARVVYYTVVVVVMYFIPILVMVCAYTMIVIRMVLRKRPGSLVTTAKEIQDKSRRKVVKMLIAVLCAFVICWTPQQALILWDLYRKRGSHVKSYVLKIKYAAMYIAYFNSALNPILYGGFNENFRTGFRDAFKCFLWKKRNTVIPVVTDSQATQRPGTSSNNQPSPKFFPSATTSNV